MLLGMDYKDFGLRIRALGFGISHIEYFYFIKEDTRLHTDPEHNAVRSKKDIGNRTIQWSVKKKVTPKGIVG